MSNNKALKIVLQAARKHLVEQRIKGGGDQLAQAIKILETVRNSAKIETYKAPSHSDSWADDGVL